MSAEQRVRQNVVNMERWRRHAPSAPGLYSLNVSTVQGADFTILNIVAMVSKKSQKEEYLNGYRIGVCGSQNFVL